MSFHGIAVPPKNKKLLRTNAEQSKLGVAALVLEKRLVDSRQPVHLTRAQSSLCREFADSRTYSITYYSNLVKDFIEFFLLSSFFAK